VLIRYDTFYSFTFKPSYQKIINLKLLCVNKYEGCNLALTLISVMYYFIIPICTYLNLLFCNSLNILV